MSVDLIRYDLLVQDALRAVVRRVLTDVAREGLPGDHHLYISFDTTAPGVRLSPRLKEKYPEEMTIVLQHQFWDLIVTDVSFEVGLSFNGIPERLFIPFSSLKGFFDPSVKFGLQFEPSGGDEDDAAEGTEDAPAPVALAPVPGPRPVQAPTSVPVTRPAAAPARAGGKAETKPEAKQDSKPAPARGAEARRPAAVPGPKESAGETGKREAPAGSKADAAKPDGTKPDATKPDAAKSDAAKPDAAKSDAAKSDAVKPEDARNEGAGGAQVVRLDAFRKK